MLGQGYKVPAARSEGLRHSLPAEASVDEESKRLLG